MFATRPGTSCLARPDAAVDIHRAMLEQRFSLKRTLTLALSVLAALALALSGTLVALTTFMQRITRELTAAIESVRYAEEAEVNLLLHTRSTDPLARATLESDLRHALHLSGAFVTTAEEARVLSDATSAVDSYLAAVSAPGLRQGQRELLYQQAYAALERLVEVNVVHARALQHRATTWDRVANGVGIGAGAVLLAAALGLLWWLNARAFRPVFTLSDAMERFGRGDSSARAPELGPAELREMALRFNQMASAIEHQRERQLAFLAGVAHDLRNPLAALKSSTALLRPGHPLSDERSHRVLALVDRQIDRLDRMIGDFLDAARIEAGQLEIQLAEHDLRTLVWTAVELFESASPAHRLVLSTPDEPVLVRCDPARIEQVLNNLISNAIKYSPGGGDVVVTVDTSGAFARIAVKDSGIGTAPEDQELIFQPFRRGRALGPSLPGVGLGLFVARRIVEAHGGRIEVASALGQGSTFTVNLPLAVHRLRPIQALEAAPHPASDRH